MSEWAQHDCEMRYLARKRQAHAEGECGGSRTCPYCEYEKATGTGRFATKVPFEHRPVANDKQGDT